MSWRTGSKLFAEMWPLIQSHITDREHRIEFTAHPMRQAGIETGEPDRYKDEDTGGGTKKWWKFWT
jgi:hypothetical protein